MEEKLEMIIQVISDTKSQLEKLKSTEYTLQEIIGELSPEEKRRLAGEFNSLRQLMDNI